MSTRRGGDVAIGVVSVLAGLAAAFSLLVVQPDPDLVTLVLALVISIGLGLTALYRFEWFVLAALAIRPALDDLKTEALDPLQPSAILGLLVIGLVLVRVLADRAHGGRAIATPMAGAYLACGLLLSISLVTSLDRGETLPAVLGFASSVALYFGIERSLRTDRRALLRLVGALAVGLVIPVATGIVQYFWTGTLEPISGLVRLDGSFTHYNPFATYLVIVLLLGFSAITAMRPGDRVFAVFPVAASLFVLVYTYARAAWISFTLGVMLLVWRIDRRVTIGVGVAVVLAAFLVPGISDRLANITAETGADGGAKTDDSLAWRISYWGEVAPLFWRNPISGVGLQVVPSLTVRGARPHNSFLQAAVEAGVLGLLGWLLLVGTAVVLTVKAYRLADRLPYGDPGSTTKLERAMLIGAVAATASTILQLISENILTDTVLQWHLNVALAHMAVMVWDRHRRDADDADDDAATAVDPLGRRADPEAPASRAAELVGARR